MALLNACLLVQRANKAVAKASAAATTQPLVAFARQLLTYCEANPEDTRAAKHLQGFWGTGLDGAIRPYGGSTSAREQAFRLGRQVKVGHRYLSWRPWHCAGPLPWHH